MTMNSSGPISLAGTTAGQSIEIENGGNGTTQISLNDTAVRNLAGVPSGQIVMPTDFYGKSNRATLTYTYSANTANASLNVTSISGYIAGKSDITITVNSGIYLYATSTGNAGLTLTGGTTGDTVTLVNNGYIMGMGGQGGDGETSGSGGIFQPTAGGTALSLGFNTTINNTNASAYIGGGGGGGAGSTGTDQGASGGGGAGGGAGGSFKNGGSYSATGGSGGSVGSSGATGGWNSISIGECTYYVGAGGGGGRIFPGTGGVAGTTNTGGNSNVAGKGGGAGGGGAVVYGMFGEANAGTGGSANNAGGSPYQQGAGGGGWGASGGNTSFYGATGRAGGKAVALNGKTVTWVSGNTTRVYGAIS